MTNCCLSKSWHGHWRGWRLCSSDLLCGLGKRGRAETVGIHPKVLSFKCSSCGFPQQSRLMGFLKWRLGNWDFVVSLPFFFLPRRMGHAWQESVVDLPVKVIPYFFRVCNHQNLWLFTTGNCISQISLCSPLQTHSLVLQWAQRFLGKETQRQGENQTQRWQLRETQRQTQR